jgi:DNA-binding MarR family transcriptional regulator
VLSLQYCFGGTCKSVTDGPKYVNMVDLNHRPAHRRLAIASEQLIELVELLFFAYRDFTGDPDHLLSTIGFGRAHHRVVHFVGRNPGMRVAELLDILKITKQSLGRVLRELIEKGYVVQEEGALDRRQRLLYLTPAGKDLHSRLMAPQLRRIERALTRSAVSDTAFRDVLLAMIDPEGREQLRMLASRSSRPATELR